MITDTKDTDQTFDTLKLWNARWYRAARREFVSLEAEDVFASLYPGEGRTAARQALARHVESLASAPLTSIELDDTLIATARESTRDKASPRGPTTY